MLALSRDIAVHFHSLFLFLLQPLGGEPLIPLLNVPDIEPVSRFSIPDINATLLFVLDIDQVLIEKWLFLQLLNG
jgi:hypothetical protein